MPYFGRVQVLGLGLLEKRELVGVDGAGNAPMRAGIDAIFKAWKPSLEKLHRLVPAAGESVFLPDLVKPPRVAAVALDQITSPHLEPTRDPDVDGVGLGQRAALNGGRRCGNKSGGHVLHLTRRDKLD
jgi:hypothetical protein